VSTPADVDNTVRVTVFAAPAEVAGGYTVDQSKGTFARTNKTGPQSPSNIPITLDTTGVPAPELTVIGTAGPDVMRAGAGGKVNLSFGDSNADVIPLVKPVDVVLRGGAGNDDLNGIGIADSGPSSAPADTGLRLEGDAGSDNLVASQREPSPRFSILLGGEGDDTLFSANRHSDGVSGGSGIDTATTDAFGDVVLSVENHLFL
jgi:hypothetical protein